MRYKLLITGKPFLINDFFVQAEYSFECLSTTMFQYDVLGHIKYFEPDAFVVLISNTIKEDAMSLRKLKSTRQFRELPIIIIGDEEECKSFNLNYPNIATLTIKKPVTITRINELISSKLDEIKKEKELEKNKSSNNETIDNNDNKNNNHSSFANTLSDKKHILVIDDDKSVLKLVKTVLSEEYNVTAVNSGRLALSFLANHSSDLILLDYEMPEENGAEVMRKLKSNQKISTIPVVFLTGISDRNTIKEVLQLSPKGYMLKPINIQKLKETIKSILE